MLDAPVHRQLWLFVITLYVITCLFIYLRVYVYHDYPIFKTVESIPTTKQVLVEWVHKYLLYDL